MRALCGAIITAGALVGLGLTAVGIGQRYTMDGRPATPGEPAPLMVHLNQMDRPLAFTLVFLTCAALAGLGITFLGLAYHHHRREREYQLERERGGAGHHRAGV
jgi:hypothetical protein